MRTNGAAAVRGSIGFGLGVLVVAVLAFFGFTIVGFILGGAVVGAALAWQSGDFRLILLAVIGADLGLFLGGVVVLMSFGVLAYDMFEVSDQPSLVALGEFYTVFVAGFAVAGATISAVTTFRIVSFYRSICAFTGGGLIGGAVIVTSEVLKLTTGVMLFLGLVISFVVTGALCGASLKASEDLSLSILEHQADPVKE